jgi:hypothetical protein
MFSVVYLEEREQKDMKCRRGKLQELHTKVLSVIFKRSDHSRYPDIDSGTILECILDK